MNTFELHVRSWEKKSDNIKKEVIANLSQGDIRFYIQLLACFSVSADYGNKTFGQMHRAHEVDDDKILNAILPIVKEHKTTSLAAQNFIDFEDKEYDLILVVEEKMTALLSSSEDYLFRVFSGYQVYEKNEQNLIHDVTNEFPQSEFKLKKTKHVIK